MPRQSRLDAPGTLHHVMIRGIERVRIFEGDKDREHFVLRVGERRYVLSQLGEREGEAIRAYRSFVEEGKGFGRPLEFVGEG